KFHRPRGPSCFRAACDGCLARVDGVPNVMTCRARAHAGAEIVTQNTLGTRDVDLLRVTDWFFPKGMNHHELFAGVVGVDRLMQSFARRVAGLGRLPKKVEAAREATRRDVDVLVVGSGPAGACTAIALANAGRDVEVIDDALVLGGSMRALASAGWREIEDEFRGLVKAKKIRARTETTAVAIYGDDVLVVGAEGPEVITAKVTVLACGAHDGVLAFEGNDVPGVVSARAAGLLLDRGVVLGKKIVIVTPEGGGPFGDAFAARASELGVAVTRVQGEPVRVSGASRVRGVVVRQGKKETKIACDALLVDAGRTASYELAAQAGAKVEQHGAGFVVAVSDCKARDRFFVVGETVGSTLDVESMRSDAAKVVRQI
ncbi:MAG TPA: FAD-dependent oxidoreductase, partial [Polyangiaceae bacterium]